MNGNYSLVVHIIHKETGLAVDIHDDNKHLVLKPLDVNESQHWVTQKTEWGTYIFINRKSGKLLDCKKHAKVEPVNHSTSQEWLCSSSGVLRNFKYNLVLSTEKKKVVVRPTKFSLNEQFCLQVCEKEVR